MAPSIGVAEYYAGKTIFITGGTGFIGLALVEKLLRSCPDVKTLYLLIRPRKGQSVEQRLQDFLKCEIFDRIKMECPENLSKLRLVPGDIMQEQLGISILDQEELERECQVVIHCAASVRFDLFIRDAVEINVSGTEKMLKLAERMKKLEVFVHMSTAYCHESLDTMEEKMYSAKHNPHDILNLVNWMSDDMLKTIEKRLIKPYHNTYAYTKELSESLVAEYSGKFPIAVARPSIILAAYNEPLPGWVQNQNGPTGLVVATCKGVCRVMHVSKDVIPDVLPLDIVVNATILLTYLTAMERPKNIRVCNLTNSGLNTTPWVEVLLLMLENSRKYPYSICLWYPSLTFYESRHLYMIHAFFVHWLPAVFLDFLLILFQQKPFMIKVQKKLYHGLEVVSRYLTGNFVFKNEYFLSLRNQITAAEREVFVTEYDKMDQRHMGREYVKGVRQYLCKDPPSTLPRARRTLKILYYIQLSCTIIFAWFFLKIMYNFGTNIFGNK